MIFIVYLILGIIPALLWTRFFRKRDKYRPEPWKRLIIVIIIGGISVYFAALFEVMLFSIFKSLNDTDFFFGVFVKHTLIVGMVEETIKFFVVWIFAFYSLDFDEPIDGLIYSAAAAIGFATVENALYAVNYGFTNFIMRSFLSTFAHIMFAAIWGYELGRYKFEISHHHKWVLALSVIIAAIGHGLFNTITVTTSFTVLPIFSVFFILFLWFFVKRFYRFMLAKTKILIIKDKIEELSNYRDCY